MKPYRPLVHQADAASSDHPLPLPISLCMIVKDEADFLPRCLQAAVSLVQEMIIIDTGSTDHTPYIARAYGATVFHYPWSNDFAAARNEAIRQAHEPWILMIDADEVLDPHTWTTDTVAPLINQTSINGYYVKLAHTEEPLSEPLQQRSIMAVDMSCRLFRRASQHQYRGRIHEDIAPSIEASAEGSLAWSNLMIWHDGYTDNTIQQKNKQERNRQLLLLQMQDEPYEPLWWYAYGTEYFQLGRWKDAAPWLRRALEALRAQKSKPGYTSDVWLKTIYALQRIGSFDEALALAEEGAAAYPDFPDLLELTASLLSSQGRWQESYAYLQQALRCGDVSHLYTTTAGTGSWRTHWLSATIIERASLAVHTNHVEDPNKAAEESLEAKRYHTPLHHAIHEHPCTLASGHFEQAARLHPNPVLQSLFLAAKAYYSQEYHEAIHSLRSFMEAAPAITPFLHLAMSLTCSKLAEAHLPYVSAGLAHVPTVALQWGDGIRPYLES